MNIKKIMKDFDMNKILRLELLGYKKQILIDFIAELFLIWCVSIGISVKLVPILSYYTFVDVIVAFILSAIASYSFYYRNKKVQEYIKKIEDGTYEMESCVIMDVMKRCNLKFGTPEYVVSVKKNNGIYTDFEYTILNGIEDMEISQLRNKIIGKTCVILNLISKFNYAYVEI